MQLFRLLLVAFALILLTACSGSDGANEVSSKSTDFTVGGSVSGLSGDGLILQINDSDTLSITTPGEFVFPDSLADSTNYVVTVASQPQGQTCSVANPSGSINNADIRNIKVSCEDNPVSATYTVGVSVTGLVQDGLVLRLNGGNDLSVVATGDYTFEALLADNDSYLVTVFTQPLNQSCVVNNPSGRISGSNVTSIAVTCSSSVAPVLYSVSGVITGLRQSGLVLQLNNDNDLAITAASVGFSFATLLADKASYNVSVLQQPDNQTCIMNNATGVVNTENVSNVNIICEDIIAPSTYTISGMVNGLTGTGLVLQLNTANNLSITASGAFAFPLQIANNSSYRVSVSSQPLNQSCTVNNATGTVNGANIDDVLVTCVDITGQASYPISGIVSGLSGSGLVLQLNNANDLAIIEPGVFTFPVDLPLHSGYQVSVANHPTGQRCSVNYGAGEYNGDVISNILVNCVGGDPKSQFSVSGIVRGLSQGELVLQINGGNDMSLTADGPFSFTNLLNDGEQYEISVLAQPNGLRCSVVNGGGTIYGVDINNVLVNCITEPVLVPDQFNIVARTSGLSGSGLVLQINNANDRNIIANGNTTWQMTDGQDYSISVLTQPSGQVCSLSRTSVTLNGSNEFVQVICATDSAAQAYTISGTVTGLEGSGLVLQNNVADDIILSANGVFTFAMPIANNNVYDVTILQTPESPSQSCTILHGSGTVSGADVSDIEVNCTTDYFTIRALVRGLTGTGLVLQSSAGDEMTIDSDGYYIFNTNIIDLTPYSVSIVNQPSNDPGCRLENASGTINGFFPEVYVVCGGSYTVSVDVRGLTGTGLVLQNNGGDDITIDAEGIYTFPTSVWNLSRYSVTIGQQSSASPTEKCGVFNGSGEILFADVSSVIVSCQTGPTVTDYAWYTDSNFNHRIDQGDVLTVFFNKPIAISGVVADDIFLPVAGDTLGLNPTFSSIANNLQVSLGETPQITVTGDFNPNSLTNGSSSGIDVAGNMTPFAISGNELGIQAVSSQSVNIIPAFVSDTRQNRFDQTAIAHGVDLADIDGDGDLDMAIGDYNGPTDMYMNYNGMFTHIQSVGDSRALAIAFADVDNDGDPDLIEGNVSFNRLYLNDGGVFSDSGATIGGGSTSSIAVGDIDKDNDLDLVIGIQSAGTGSKLYVLLNDAGSFATRVDLDVTDDVTSLSLGDIDADGDLDLIIGTDDSSVYVYTNNQGVLSDSGQLLNKIHPVPVSTATALGDVDNDGDLDLVVGNDVFNNEIYINDSGVFVRSTLSIGAGATHVALGDIDNDGDLDAIVGGKVYMNFDGLFTQISTLTNSAEYALGDIDNDGDLDLVTEGTDVFTGSAAN